MMQQDLFDASEATASWGGSWTEEKLKAFENYVKAYLKIMNKYRDRYHWRLIYFDGFAGSGCRLQKEDDLQIFPQDSDVYKGAAERVLKIPDRGFDFYYFIDKDQKASEALGAKLKKLKPGAHLIFRADDAGNQIKRWAYKVGTNKEYKTLMLLDPFGMQIKWDSIELLKERSVDLWLLLPSGVIVNRLLKKTGGLTAANRLVEFFGMSEEDIQNYFYFKEESLTFFGEVEAIRKCEEPIQKIAELYISRLQKIFPYVSKKPLRLLNSKNCPIFHFVFASKNETAVKIASDITGKL